MIHRCRKLVIFVLVVSCLALIVVGCGQKKKAAQNTQQEEEVEKEATPVEVVKASTGVIRGYTTVVGQAEPEKTVQVSPEMQGRVKKVKVETGDKVQAGELLVQLKQEDIQVQVDQAQANLEVAKSNLEQVLAGTREERLAQLKAQVEQAEANYEQAKKNYERQKKLFEKEIISKQQLEASESQYIAARSGYKSAKENLQLAEEGASKEEIKTLKAQVKQAEVGLESARLRLEKTEITAPISGVVSQVNIEEGEVAGMQPVVSLVKLDPVKIMTYVSEQYINKLQAGEEVTVEFSALSKTYTGEIASINPVVDQRKGKFPVKILIDNPEGLIKAGMYAEVKFKVEESRGQIVLPREAVLNSEGENYVYIVEDGKAVYKKVTTGLANKERIVVENGVDAGDQVITAGNERITDQDKVRIVSRGDK